ncbi:MAG TPA: hypothetical protein VFE03_06105 [Caulobacteraceae bacterium]|jgi:hypothetical protein|nr:hypothetical protein [Caulobacteraceae bacterium]
MKNLLLVLSGAALSALALAACTPPTPHHPSGHWGEMKVISKLDCPDRQGELRRQTAAADGRTCVYTDEAGAEVTLQMVSLEGTDTETALAPLETQLKAELPARVAKPETADADGDDKDNVNIDLPGIHIHARGDGGAHVETGRVDVKANDEGAHVRVNKDVRVDEDGKTVSHGGGNGGVSVDADDSGAVIRLDDSRRRNVRMTLILASETAGPHGYKLAGYEARGPRGGPLAVASVKAKTDERDGLYRDMRQLLNRNVGG